MNDYNRGALPDPCLRLDYGFGDEWKSVELGDGTGYVRLSDYEKLKAANDKLRMAFSETLLRLAAANEAAVSDYMDDHYCEMLREMRIEVGE